MNSSVFASCKVFNHLPPKYKEFILKCFQGDTPIYDNHPESEEHLCIRSVHLFCFNRFSGVQCDAENCLMQLYVGSCHMVNAEIAVPNETPADSEVRGVICFLQADEILGYLAEDASSRVELLCCTTMHVHILPSRYNPYCMSNSTGTCILHTVQTWYLWTFPVSKNEGAPCW